MRRQTLVHKQERGEIRGKAGFRAAHFMPTGADAAESFT